MKNLKKIAKSNLKKIIGGAAPICEYGEMACRVPAEDGYPAYWVCVPVGYGCRS